MKITHAAIGAALLTAMAAACAPSNPQPRTAPPPQARTVGAPVLPPGQGAGPGQSVDVPAPDHTPNSGPAGVTTATTAPRPALPTPAADGRLPEPAAAQDLCADGRAPGARNASDVQCAKCTVGSFNHEDAGRKKLDLWFVADTSPSLKSTRRQIVEGIKGFIEKLPPETDYNIGVIPAHADVGFAGRASSGLGGRLWRGGAASAGRSVSTEPVLKSAVYRQRVARLPQAQRGAKAMEYLGEDLANRLIEMDRPFDAATDGGEAGLLSLDLALTTHYQENRAAGMFRDGVTQAIVFFSDENDICATGYYPDANGVGGRETTGPAGTLNTEFVSAQDHTPIEHRAHEMLCEKRMVNGVLSPITPESVFAHLKEKTRAGQPGGSSLLVSAIIYHPGSEATPKIPEPPAANPQNAELTASLRYWHEKDFGYGYMEFVALAQAAGEGVAQGALVDLNATEYRTGLGRIGEAASGLLRAETTYNLGRTVDVDTNALCLSYTEGGVEREIPRLEPGAPATSTLSYGYNPQTKNVELVGVGPQDTATGHLQVKVMYCESPNSYRILTQDRRSQADIARTLERHYPAVADLFFHRGGCTDTIARINRAAAARAPAR